MKNILPYIITLILGVVITVIIMNTFFKPEVVKLERDPEIEKQINLINSRIDSLNVQVDSIDTELGKIPETRKQIIKIKEQTINEFQSLPDSGKVIMWNNSFNSIFN